MENITLAPLQWSLLEDIDVIEPVGDGDAGCLADIRDALRKHGKMQRFGIALLHSHFDMADGEIVVETADRSSRTLLSTVVKEDEAGTAKVATILMLRDGDAASMTWCRQYCRRSIFGHSRDHNRAR